MRNRTGVADLRYRAEFKQWTCEIIIRFNADAITLPQIVNLLNVAGFCAGVGDGRPEKSGMSYGMFHVA